MLRTLLKPFVDVRRDELPKVVLLFFNFYLIIASYYIVKSIRGALVIEKVGADYLPYIWIATVFCLAIFVAIYSKLIDKFKRQWVVTITATFFIFNLLVLRPMLDMPADFLGAVFTGATAENLEFYWNLTKTSLFYIWGDIFSVVMVEQFWSFTNDLYKSKDAKRLYGIIGSGGILGGATGSGVVAMIVPVVGTANMIFICIGVLGLLIVSVFAVQWLVDRQGGPLKDHVDEREAVITTEARNEPKKSDLFEGFKLIAKDNYLFLIAAALVLTQIISTMIDFQFNKTVEANFAGTDAKSAFFGQFYFWLNIVAFSVMIFIVSPVNRIFGIIAGLLMLPLVNLFGTTLFLAVPLPMVIFALKLADKSLNYSINRASKEILYIPTDKRVKYKAKAAIDMFGYRAAKVLGAGLIIPLVKYLDFGSSHLSMINVVFLLGMVAVVFALIKKYNITYKNHVTHTLGGRAISYAKTALENTDVTNVINEYQTPAEIKKAIHRYAMDNHLDPDLRRRVVFTLLAQIYPKEDIYLAYAASIDKEKAGNPEEFLSSVLRGGDKRRLLPLLQRV
jgi:AAA family ATP:ADP antiporter